MSTLLNKIQSTPNLDVTTRVVNKLGATGDVLQIEASITQFTQNEEKAQVLKKVTVSATNKDFEKAQNAALEKAVELLGL